MKVELKNRNGRFQSYLENKEVTDQVLKVITDNNLSRKQVEDVFSNVRRLLDDLPVISSGEELEIEII